MAFAKHPSTKSLVSTSARLTCTLTLLLVCLPALFFSPVQAQTNTEAFLKPGELVVSQSKVGQVVAINADGKTRSLASGLQNPRSVLVLDDGETVLIAENGADRISAMGGAFGPRPTPLVAIARPEGMALALDGEVYITSLDGSISRLNVESRALTKVTAGLTVPIGIAFQGQSLYVVDAGTGRLVRVTLAGEKELIAENLGQPTGVAIGPDRSIYVADFTGDRLMKVVPNADGTFTLSEFAKLKAPVYISLIPAPPRPNEPFSIAVTIDDGVVQLDGNGTPFGKKVNMPATYAVGLATVPGGPPIPAPTTVPGGAGVPTVPGSGSTVAPTTATTLLGPDTSGGGGSTGLALLAGVVILCAGAGLIAYFVFSRREGNDFGNDLGGFGEMEKGVNLAAAVGPCAAIESRLAEVDQAIRGMQEQWSSAERRQKEAAENATKAKVREEAAREALAATRKKLEAEDVAQKASGKDAEPDNKRVSLDDLNLQTEEGWAALRAFGAKEISAVELRKRWDSLGEKDAISAVLGSGQAMKPEERAAVEELDAAKEERLHAERDVSEAADELKRLEERVSQVKKQQVEVKRALDGCHAEQKKGELQAATDAKQAFADAEEAATLAAFALRSDDVAAAFAAGASDAPAAKPDPKAAAKPDPKAPAKADPKAPAGGPGLGSAKAAPDKTASRAAAPGAPGSARPAPDKPGSGAPGSAKPAPDKPGSDKSGSGAAAPGAPGSARPAPDNSGSDKSGPAKPEAGPPTTAPLSGAADERETKPLSETVRGQGRPATVQAGNTAPDAPVAAALKPSTPPKPAGSAPDSAGPASGGPRASSSSADAPAPGADKAPAPRADKAAAQAAAKKAVQQAIADAGSAAPPAKPGSPAAPKPAASQVRDAPPASAPTPPGDLSDEADVVNAPKVDPGKKRSIFGRKTDPES